MLLCEGSSCNVATFLSLLAIDRNDDDDDDDDDDGGGLCGHTMLRSTA